MKVASGMKAKGLRQLYDNDLSSYCRGSELMLILVRVKVEVEWRSRHELR